MTDSVTQICNRALQKLGAAKIASLSENSKNSRECQVAYDPCRKALLRAHPWNFATIYATLPALASPPNPPPSALGGQTLNTYELPNDFIRLVAVMLTNWSWLYYESNYFESNDYIMQNGTIVTWVSAPLNIRYVYDFTNANKFDAIFSEALAGLIAQELCEMLTQSNTKKAAIEKDFENVIQEARRINAFDKPPGVSPDDDYLKVRL